MGAGRGLALKTLQWFNRGVQFCCAALVLAIFSYFLATLNNHGLDVQTWIRAVEGISGAAALYTGICLLTLCCLAGYPLTSFLAMALDVAFMAAFIYVASANRGGAGSCTGRVDTPFGSGDAATNVPDSKEGGFTNLPSFQTACKLQTACFAVSLIAIFFFIFSAITELYLGRHRARARRFGPSPQNDYTSGYGHVGSPNKRMGAGLFGFLHRSGTTKSQNPNVLPEHTHPDAVRASYATEATAVEPPRVASDEQLAMHSYHKYTEPGYAGLAQQDPASLAYGHGSHGLGHGHGHDLEGESAVPHAQYPAGNYRYDDGVYSTRAV